MIKIENLTKAYGKHVAVDNLSIKIEKGRIYGFLGPNGAGKSTTMNMMTGYISASSGRVLIKDIDIAISPAKAKKYIGYLPEIPPLYPDMTVREYLTFVANLKKVAKEEKAQSIENVMLKTGIKDVESRLIKNLSKGYKQRVGIAQAIMGNPEIIILDEPTVGLDPKQIIEIRELIRSLKEQHTVILSSHILSEVSAVCDEIIILSRGKLVAQDTPENLENAGNQTDGQRIKLVVKADKTTVEGLFEGNDRIADCKVSDAKEKGCVNLSIVAKKDEDVREEVSVLLMENKCPIFEMNVTKQSLEDVFLELTDKEPESVDEDEDEDDIEDESDEDESDENDLEDDSTEDEDLEEDDASEKEEK